MQPQLTLYLTNSGELLLHSCNEVLLGGLCCLKLLIECLADEASLMLKQHRLAQLAGWSGQLQAAVQKAAASPSKSHRAVFTSLPFKQVQASSMLSGVLECGSPSSCGQWSVQPGR